MPRKKEASFEENLAELEQIVDKLESGEASLKDVIDNYTLGMELSRKCLAELKSVEDRMNVILSEENGKGTREDGSIATRILDGTDYEIDFDSMIVAVSEGVDKALAEGASPEGLFSAGDYNYGPKTVVEAVQSAKEQVAEISSFLGLA